MKVNDNDDVKKSNLIFIQSKSAKELYIKEMITCIL